MKPFRKEFLVVSICLAVSILSMMTVNRGIWAAPPTLIEGNTPAGIGIPVQVNSSGVVAVNATLSGGSITISNTQFGISQITANSTATTSQVAVTSANGVIADNSDTARKTILACNKDSLYNSALGLTSPVTAANATAIIPPLNCIALSTNPFTNASYMLGYSTNQATTSFTSGH